VLASVCRRLSSSVTLPACGPTGRRACGRLARRYCTAGQYGYVPLGRHLGCVLLLPRTAGLVSSRSFSTSERFALGSRPSQDRGTTTSAKFSKSWELSSLCCYCCCYPIQVSMSAVAIPVSRKRTQPLFCYSLMSTPTRRVRVQSRMRQLSLGVGDTVKLNSKRRCTVGKVAADNEHIHDDKVRISRTMRVNLRAKNGELIR